MVVVLQKLGLGCRGIREGHLSVVLPYHLPSLSVMGILPYILSFPIYSTKEKDVTVYSAETNAHHGHPMRLILYSLPYGLGHPFQLVCKVTQINPHHQTSLLKKAKKLVCLRIYRYLCTSKEILSTKGASSDARMFFSFFKCMFNVFRRDDGQVNNLILSL